MLWAMLGTMVTIWAVIAGPVGLFVFLRRRKGSRNNKVPGVTPKTGAPV